MSGGRERRGRAWRRKLRSSLFSSNRSDDRADMLAGKRTGQVAGDEAINDLDFADMLCLLQEIEHWEFENGIVKAPGLHLVDRNFRDELRVLRRLRIRVV